MKAPNATRGGASLNANSRPGSRTGVQAPSSLPENYNSTAILSEQTESEARVVNEADRTRRASIAGERREFAAAYDLAQRNLARKQPPVDANGVALGVGQEVRALPNLWYTSPTGLRFLSPGTRGAVSEIDERKVVVLFEGLAKPYPVRVDRVSTALEIVA